MTPELWPHIRSIARCVLPVWVGPRMARTGASERGAIMSECGSARGEGKVPSRHFRPVLTLFSDSGAVLTPHSGAARQFGRRTAGAEGIRAALPRVGWKTAGAAA